MYSQMYRLPSSNGRPPFVDLRARMRVTIGLLTAFLVAELATNVVELGHMRGPEAGLFYSVYMQLFAITAIAFVAFIVGAHRNAEAIQGRALGSAAWLVAAFVVPIINLWKPRELVAEIWRASASTPTSPETAEPRVVRAWWGAWLVAVFSGGVPVIGVLAAAWVIRQVQPGPTELQIFMVVNSLAMAHATWRTIRLVRELYARQVGGRGAAAR